MPLSVLVIMIARVFTKLRINRQTDESPSDTAPIQVHTGPKTAHSATSCPKTAHSATSCPRLPTPRRPAPKLPTPRRPAPRLPTPRRPQAGSRAGGPPSDGSALRQAGGPSGGRQRSSQRQASPSQRSTTEYTLYRHVRVALTYSAAGYRGRGN